MTELSLSRHFLTVDSVTPNIIAHPINLSSKAALERALAQELRPSPAQPPPRPASMKHKPLIDPTPKTKPQSQPRSNPLT